MTFAQEVQAGVVAQVQDQLNRIAGEVKGREHGLSARLAAVEQALVSSSDRPFTSAAHGGGAAMVRMAIQELADDQAFGALQSWNQGTARAALRGGVRAALVHGPGGMPSDPDRGSIVVSPVRPLRLLDVIPSRGTDRDAVEFVQLAVVGDADEQVSEGAPKAEIDLEGTLKRAEIATIAAWTSASRQVLSDHQALESTIGGLLGGKLADRLERAIIGGFISEGGKIVGLIQQGIVLVPSVGTTPPDRIGEAVSSMRAQGHQPTVLVLHPSDWLAIQLTRDKDDNYVFGSPTAPVQPALWNVPVVLSSALDTGTALALDTNYITVLDRENSSLLVSNSHADYFTRNLVAILGELRAGLEVRVASAAYVIDLAASA